MVIAIIILFVLLISFMDIMIIVTGAIIPGISLLFLTPDEIRIITDSRNDGKISLHRWNLLNCIVEVINIKSDYFYFKLPSFPFGFIIELCCMVYNLFGRLYRMYHCRKYDVCIEKTGGLTWRIDAYVNFFNEHNYECHIHNRKIKSSYKDVYESSVPSICISNEANVTFKMITGQKLKDH